MFTTSECAEVDGAYQWAVVGESLRLTPIDDPCSSRKAVLAAQPWERQSFMVRLMSAFDDALAPIFASLDNLDAYVDPRLAPGDFIDWLSGWVALTPNHGWPLRHRRERIAGETRLSLSWGTVDGVKEVVSIFAGVPCDQVEIEDSGEVEGSATPGASFPDGGSAQLTVRVRVPDPANFDVARLRRVVGTAKPAHLPHEVEVLGA
jgi:phage tail-like protein